MKIDDCVRQVLVDASCDGDKLFLNGDLDRQLYLKTNKVLQALGGKWNRSAKAHIFPEDASPLIADAVTTGEYVDPKKEFQFFETPQAIASEMCDVAGVTDGMVVLEPSAGHGRIAREIEARGAVLDVCEIQGKAAEQLLEAVTPRAVFQCDFLSLQPAPEYDAVVMNPPFTRGQDVDHVSHALQFLKPGGSLVAIMSSGVLFRSDRKTTAFRDTVLADATVIELPNDAFRESGTMVRTVRVETMT